MEFVLSFGGRGKERPDGGLYPDNFRCLELPWHRTCPLPFLWRQRWWWWSGNILKTTKIMITTIMVIMMVTHDFPQEGLGWWSDQSRKDLLTRLQSPEQWSPWMSKEFLSKQKNKLSYWMFPKSYLDKLMVVSSITFSTALFVLSIVIVRKIIWISIPYNISLIYEEYWPIFEILCKWYLKYCANTIWNIVQIIFGILCKYLAGSTSRDLFFLPQDSKFSLP